MDVVPFAKGTGMDNILLHNLLGLWRKGNPFRTGIPLLNKVSWYLNYNAEFQSFATTRANQAQPHLPVSQPVSQ